MSFGQTATRYRLVCCQNHNRASLMECRAEAAKHCVTHSLSFSLFLSFSLSPPLPHSFSFSLLLFLLLSLLLSLSLSLSLSCSLSFSWRKCRQAASSSFLWCATQTCNLTITGEAVSTPGSPGCPGLLRYETGG